MTAVDLTPDAIAKLVKATWNHKENSPTAEPGTDAGRRAGDLLRYADKRYATLKGELDAVQAAVDDIAPSLSDEQVQALGGQVGAALIADPDFADRLADLVVDKMAERLTEPEDSAPAGAGS